MSEQPRARDAAGTDTPKVRSRVQVTAALVRTADSLLLVQEQLGADGRIGWSLPGGGVESGELLTEATAREVREEAGLHVGTPAALAFVVHHDTPPYPSALLCALDYRSFSGEISIDDPSSKVLDARFFPIDEALHLMASTSVDVHWKPAVAYLTGRAPAGAAWLYRRDENGVDELRTLVGAPRGAAEILAHELAP